MGGSLHPDQGDDPRVFTGLLIPSLAPNPRPKAAWLCDTHQAGFRALALETTSSELLKKLIVRIVMVDLAQPTLGRLLGAGHVTAPPSLLEGTAGVRGCRCPQRSGPSSQDGSSPMVHDCGSTPGLSGQTPKRRGVFKRFIEGGVWLTQRWGCCSG